MTIKDFNKQEYEEKNGNYLHFYSTYMSSSLFRLCAVEIIKI